MQSTSTDRRPSIRKNRIGGGVLAVTVIVLFAVANLPFDYVERNGDWVGSWQTSDGGAIRYANAMPTMAGWPFRYWVRYELQDRTEDRYWSSLSLFANLVAAVVCGTLVFSFLQLRHRAIESARNRRFTQRMFDATVAVAIVSLPLVVFGLAARTHAQHRRFVERASRFGNCQLSCWLPEPFAASFPAGLVDAWTRVRYVKLFNPDDRIVREAASLATLTGFDFRGGQYDADSLNGFLSSHHCATARITYRELDDQLLSSLLELPWLVELGLNGTNLDSEMFHRFDNVQHLRWVDVQETKIELSRLGKPQWSQSAELLRFPRPRRGTSDSLSLSGWPRLRRLTVDRRSVRSNGSTLTLRFSHLPKFETLVVDRVQKHALTCTDLPQFKGIFEDVEVLFFERGRQSAVPCMTWLTALQIDGAASLTEISCFARDLESLSIRNAPALRRLKLGSYLVSAGDEIRSFETVDAQHCQSWIDHLGGGDGPVRVELIALPLAGIDLSPLVNNSRIRHLRLTKTGVSFEQIKSLDGMTQLETLDLHDCRLEQGDFAWLINRFPLLRDLRVDTALIKKFELTQGDRLQSLTTTTFQQLSDLRVVDVPDLIFDLHMVLAPQRLVIRNAPSLRGIAVEQPWPGGAELSGLRDLEWFLAGGAKLDDAIVDALFECDEVDRLMLAHTSISKERLSALGKFSRLSSLIVPGALVDDDVTAHWKSMTMLQELNLDDSAVSEGTFRWLAGIESLRRLSVNRISLTDTAAIALSGLTQLSELRIADATLNPRPLITLLNAGVLERLDVSGTPMKQDLVDAICRCPSMKWLTVHRGQISEDLLQQLIAANSGLVIDVGAAAERYSKETIAALTERFEQARFGPSSEWIGVVSTVVQGLSMIESVASTGAPTISVPIDSPGAGIPLGAMPQFGGRAGVDQFQRSGTIDPDRFRSVP